LSAISNHDTKARRIIEGNAFTSHGFQDVLDSRLTIAAPLPPEATGSREEIERNKITA